MRWAAAIVIGCAVLALIAWRPGPGLSQRLAPYLDRTAGSAPSSSTNRRPPNTAAIPWVVGGALAGALIAQGDLFISGPGRSTAGLAIAGGLGGYLVWRIRKGRREQEIVRRFRLELPVITDVMAMLVVSGESISTSIDRIATSTNGVVADSLRFVSHSTHDGTSVPAALMEAARSAPHPDGRRLYETLAHAHEQGGRLSDLLIDLSADFRAAIERDLTAEGGRRAIAAYGPVLALMVPTALLFLLYPTLVGLRSLSGTP